MKRICLLFLALGLRPWGDPAIGYPLDAAEESGIHRLEAYDRAQSVLLERGTLKPGSLLTSQQIQLRLSDTGFTMPAPDPEFAAKILEMVGPDAPHYGISVLDITDPAQPRLAEINGNRSQNPGSVGKLMVALAWFQALADVYPDDVDARKRILFETQITANDFIVKDGHVVPFWKPGDPMVVRRPIEIGDTANLWTWFDWMASASSNAAASQLISELVLFKKFGGDYPVSAEVAAAYFADTPQKELTAHLREAIQTPLTRNGLDVKHLRQGSFFTREGKRRIPGGTSLATSAELLHYLALMEQGKLVDSFSSLEIKKLIYLTDGRIRYAASPALDESAVYFKSGSLYSCKPEPGYQCGKYEGNKWNYLNSATIVETHDPNQPLHYIVVVLSNVLKKNSAEEHESLATQIHRLMEQQHPAKGAPSL
jgi:hypothetical protein